MKRRGSILFIACLLSAICVSAQTVPATETQYLSGVGKDDAISWDFFCTEGRKSGTWTKIPVPSNWELEGFGNYQYGGDRQRESNPYPKEKGLYKRTFVVPANWKGRVVRIVFEGAMTDTDVQINGKSAGPTHQGGFYQFKYDISSLLNYGATNLLEVTVSKESTNTSVNRAERLGDYWNFGGIFRPVYLEALPSSFIDWTAIDARADGTFAVDVNLGGNINEVDKITGQIIDAKGQPAGATFETKPVNSKGRLQTRIANASLWTAETPSLYKVRLTIYIKQKPAHVVTNRLGFRTFEVRKGDGFYLNGQRILLKGANRHSFWPDSGRTLSPQISYDDVKLIKEMNMNAVRMSHYPPDTHFLDACDELGGWQKSYDTPTGSRLIGQIVRRDVNHPSIVLWDNGNEGGWNKENDDEFARWDPQKREVLHPWEKFRLTNTDHYEKFDSHTRLANGPDIYMPTEFLHGLYDGGIGAGMWDYWELIRQSKVGGGGFLWALVDECVKRTDQNGKLDCAGNRGPDGIVGPYREREGSFNTVREIWSPVQVSSPVKLADNFAGNVQLANRFDFTNLNECTFTLQLGRFPTVQQQAKGHLVVTSSTRKGPNVAPHSVGNLKFNLPNNWQNADVLYLVAKDPKGNELWTWSWSIAHARIVTPLRPGAQLKATDDGSDRLRISDGITELVFNKAYGALETVTRDGKLLPLGNGPQFLAFRRNDRKYENVGGAAKLSRFDWRRELNSIVIEAAYTGPLRFAHWKIHSDGKQLVADLEFEYQFEGLVDMLGINFESDTETIEKIRWLGFGPYRVWQNRLAGTRLDVWENAYNDSTPGESWIYPEFKGYFRGWRWARLQTTNGRISISSDRDDSFLGLFTPKDGVNGLLELPDIGIAFLDVIPAMRNKFHTTDEIGPQSKPQQVSGTKRQSIQFRF